MAVNHNSPRIHSVKFNILMNVILTTSSFIFPLITVPYVSRILGPNGTGVVAWAQTFVSYFSLVALLGINVYGVRECAKVRENREELSQVVQEQLAVLFVSTSIVYIMYLLFIFTIPRTRENIPLMLIFSVVIWLASCGLEWFYQAIEQYGYITVRNIFMKLVALILMFILVRTPLDYRWYGVTVVVSAYGSNILNVLRLRKFVDFSMHRHLDPRRHFKAMTSFAVSSISAGMYTQLDMLLIGFLCSNVVVGLYQLVLKVKGICIAAVNSVGSVMLPRLSYYESKNSRSRTNDLIGKNINMLFIISLSVMSILIMGAEPIVSILGGSQFLKAGMALQIIAPTMLFAATNSILSQYMVACSMEKQYAAINLFAVVFSLISGIVLINLFSLYGAAASVCLTEFVALMLRLIILRDSLRDIQKHLDIGRIVLAAVISFTICWLFVKYLPQMNSFLLLIVEFISYNLVYLVLLFLFKESLLHTVLRRK